MIYKALPLPLFLQCAPQHVELNVIYDAIVVEVYGFEALSYISKDSLSASQVSLKLLLLPYKDSLVLFV